MKEDYIIELSWGCPSEKYPINGIFQFGQAQALQQLGKNIVFAAIDMRSVRRWRRWGIVHREWKGVEVYEINFPYGPLSVETRVKIETRQFFKLIEQIVEDHHGEKPKCIHIHNSESGICAYKYCVDNEIPYVITEHSIPNEKSSEINNQKQAVLKGAAKVIAVSGFLAKKLDEMYGVHPIIIGNLVDTSAYEVKPKHNKAMTFLTASRITKEKGVLELIEAFYMLQKEERCALIIMGEGTALPELRKRIDAYDLRTSVKLIEGTFTQSRFAEQLGEADCFVLPSHAESFGMVFIEALSAGVPVIATKCGGPEDIINDENGLLVPVGDIERLKEAMQEMMHSVDRYNPMSISQNCKSEYDSKVIAAKIAQELDSATSRNNVEETL